MPSFLQILCGAKDKGSSEDDYADAIQVVFNFL